MGIPTDDQSSLYLKTELEARGIYTVSNLTMAIVGKIGSIQLEDERMVEFPSRRNFLVGELTPTVPTDLENWGLSLLLQSF